jgi:hypothetical protein
VGLRQVFVMDIERFPPREKFSQKAPCSARERFSGVLRTALKPAHTRRSGWSRRRISSIGDCVADLSWVYDPTTHR